MFIDTKSLQFTVEHKTSDWCTRSIDQSWFIMFGYVSFVFFVCRVDTLAARLFSHLFGIDRNSFSFFRLRFRFRFIYSFVAVGIAFADISIENIARRSRSTATATRTNCIRWLCHCVRCYISIVCTIAIVELMLFAGVCTTIFIFGEIIASSCNTGPVSKC